MPSTQLRKKENSPSAEGHRPETQGPQLRSNWEKDYGFGTVYFQDSGTMPLRWKPPSGSGQTCISSQAKPNISAPWYLETGILLVAPLAIPSCQVRGRWGRPPCTGSLHSWSVCDTRRAAHSLPTHRPTANSLGSWGTLSLFSAENLHSHRKKKWVFLKHSRLVYETEKGDSNSWIQHKFHYTELPCLLTRRNILVLLKI